MKVKYYVYSDMFGAYISTSSSEATYDNELSLEGSFDVFSHAKKFAMDLASVKVDNFKCDLSEARCNKNALSRLTKKTLLSRCKGIE